MIERVFNREVNIETGGRPATPQRIYGEAVGLNELVIDVINDSVANANFFFRVGVDHPAYTERWQSIKSYSTDSGSGFEVPHDAAQDRMENPRTLCIFLMPDERRRVRIFFDSVPRDKDSRAGVYPGYVEVFNSSAAYSAKQCTELVDFKAIIRPFKSYEVEFEEENQRVNILRRKRKYNLELRNSGNDWAYFKVTTFESADVDLSLRQNLVAVPPPSNGEQSATRLVPMTAKWKRAKWLGPVDGVSSNLPVVVQSVDAPSVFPLPVPAGSQRDVLNAKCLNPVTLGETTPVDLIEAEMTYKFPIANTVTGFFKNIFTNARGFATSLLLFAGMFLLFSIAFQRFVRPLTNLNLVGQLSKSQVGELSVNVLKAGIPADYKSNAGFKNEDDQPVTLVDSKRYLFVEGDGADLSEYQVEYVQSSKETQSEKVPLIKVGSIVKSRVSMFSGRFNRRAVQVLDLSEFFNKFPNARIVKIYGQTHMGIFKNLFGAYPNEAVKGSENIVASIAEDNSEIKISSSLTEIGEGEAAQIKLNPLGGKSFGTKGEVELNGQRVNSIWSDNEIRLTIPAEVSAAGKTITVVVSKSSGAVLGSVSIAVKPAVNTVPPDPIPVPGPTGGNSSDGGDGGGRVDPIPPPVPVDPGQTIKPIRLLISSKQYLEQFRESISGSGEIPEPGPSKLPTITAMGVVARGVNEKDVSAELDRLQNALSTLTPDQLSSKIYLEAAIGYVKHLSSRGSGEAELTAAVELAQRCGGPDADFPAIVYALVHQAPPAGSPFADSPAVQGAIRRSRSR